jgi:RecB family exonuclease
VTQRLRHAANVQAEQNALGWRILPELVEAPFELELLPGFLVRGKIDRVEQHKSSGEYRIVDLKSADKGETPAATHFSSPRPDAPAYAALQLLSAKGKPQARQWSDLQLPLYARSLRERLGPEAKISCAYFALPKAVTESALLSFDELLAPEIQSSAETCAKGVAEDILSGVFWPPKERLPYDNFERLCPPGEWGLRFENVFETDAAKEPAR